MVVIGDGTNQPLGIFSASGIASVSSIGSISYDILLQMDESIAEEYRADPSLCWVTNQTVRRYCRALKDDNHMPLLQRPLERGAPLTILDHPVLVNRHVPAGCLALGVLSKYWILDREQVGIESTTSGGDAFRKHQVWLKVWERWDGKIVHKTDCWCIGSGITG
jgi:HK97 family phage major capsid protein